MNLKEKLVAKKEKVKEWYSENQEEIKMAGYIALGGIAGITGAVIGVKIHEPNINKAGIDVKKMEDGSYKICTFAPDIFGHKYGVPYTLTQDTIDCTKCIDRLIPDEQIFSSK